MKMKCSVPETPVIGANDEKNIQGYGDFTRGGHDFVLAADSNVNPSHSN